MITGARGQLGRELVRLGSGHTLLAIDHSQLDICDAKAVIDVCHAFKPDVIINAAAYTAVDRAESDREQAHAVNCNGPKNLALAATSAGIPLLHVSTDYVFDGAKHGAYVEDDPVAPLGVYGTSKLAGEKAVQQHASKWMILRTSWVFSSHGNNFVKTMLRLGADRETLAIVADQYGCPTSANELARAIYVILDAGLNDDTCGVYHFCQPEPTTWFEFAKSIFSEALEQDIELNVANVNAIATSDYPTDAQRPENSVLDCSKFEHTFNFTIRPWSESLHDVIKELKHG